MENIIKRLNGETLLWLGVPGSGKTIVQTIIGFAVANTRIWASGREGKKKAGVRIAPDFDHFKDRAGRSDVSSIFDDGDLSRMAARKLKSFLDAKKKYSMSTERYTSCKFVIGEFRSAADNKVDLAKEQHMVVNGEKRPLTIGYKPMSYDEFVAFIRPAFHHEMEPLDIEAVLRRSTMSVNTHWWLYVRRAGTRLEHEIERYPMSTSCFIQPAFIKALAKWDKTGENISEPQRAVLRQAEEQLFRTALYPERFQQVAEAENSPSGGGAVSSREPPPRGRPLDIQWHGHSMFGQASSASSASSRVTLFGQEPSSSSVASPVAHHAPQQPPVQAQETVYTLARAKQELQDESNNQFWDKSKSLMLAYKGTVIDVDKRPPKRFKKTSLALASVPGHGPDTPKDDEFLQLWFKERQTEVHQEMTRAQDTTIDLTCDADIVPPAAISAPVQGFQGVLSTSAVELDLTLEEDEHPDTANAAPGEDFLGVVSISNEELPEGCG